MLAKKFATIFKKCNKTSGKKSMKDINGIIALINVVTNSTGNNTPNNGNTIIFARAPIRETLLNALTHTGIITILMHVLSASVLHIICGSLNFLSVLDMVFDSVIMLSIHK